MRNLGKCSLVFLAALAMSSSAHVHGQTTEPQCAANDPICLEGGYSNNEGSLTMLQRRIWADLNRRIGTELEQNMTQEEMEALSEWLLETEEEEQASEQASSQFPGGAFAPLPGGHPNIGIGLGGNRNRGRHPGDMNRPSTSKLQNYVNTESPGKWTAPSVYCFLMRLVCGWGFGKGNVGMTMGTMASPSGRKRICGQSAATAKASCKYFGLGPDDPFVDACVSATRIVEISCLRRATSDHPNYVTASCNADLGCPGQFSALPPGPAKIGQNCNMNQNTPCVSGVCARYASGTKCCASYHIAPGENAAYCSGFVGDDCVVDRNCNASLVCGTSLYDESGSTQHQCTMKVWKNSGKSPPTQSDLVAGFIVAEKGQRCQWSNNGTLPRPGTNGPLYPTARNSNCKQGLTCANDGSKYSCQSDGDTVQACSIQGTKRLCAWWVKGKQPGHAPAPHKPPPGYDRCRQHIGMGRRVLGCGQNGQNPMTFGHGFGGAQRLLLTQKVDGGAEIHQKRGDQSVEAQCKVVITIDKVTTIQLTDPFVMPDTVQQALLASLDMNVTTLEISGACQISVYPQPQYRGTVETFGTGSYSNVGTVRSAILTVDPGNTTAAALETTPSLVQTLDSEVQTSQQNAALPDGSKANQPSEPEIMLMGDSSKSTQASCCDDTWAFAAKPNGDVVGILKGPVTGSGKTELHILSAGTNYQSFALHASTPQSYTTEGNWKFGIKGNSDLVMILMGPTTGSGKTEVHILSAASNYQQYSLHAATAYGITSPDEWDFVVKSNGDLVGILKGPSTGSGKTEVHAVTAGSNYQTYYLHAATAMGYTSNPSWAFAVTPTGDIAGILKGPTTGSGRTELHVLSAGSNYGQFALQTATALAYTFNDCWSFMFQGNSNMIAVLKGPTTGSGSTEVHTTSRGSNFGQYTLQTGTAMEITGACPATTTTTTTTDQAEGILTAETILAAKDESFGTEAAAFTACNADAACKGIYKGFGTTDWVMLIPGTQTWDSPVAAKKSVTYYPWLVATAPGYEITDSSTSLYEDHHVDSDPPGIREDEMLEIGADLTDDEGKEPRSSSRPILEPYINGMDKPENHDERRLSSHIDRVHPETGRRLKMKYDALLADNVTVMNLDDIHNLVGVTCDDQRGVMLLETDTSENADSLMHTLDSAKNKALEAGLVLTGHVGWGCMNEQGASQSIMHRISKVEVGPTTKIIQLQSSKAKLEEVFESLSFSMTTPATKKGMQDTALITTKEAVQNIQGGTRFGRRRRRNAPSRRRHCFSCFAKEEAAKAAAEARQKAEEAKVAAEQKAEEAKQKAEAAAKAAAKAAARRAKEAKQQAEEKAEEAVKASIGKAKEEAERVKADAEKAAKEADKLAHEAVGCAKNPVQCSVDMAKKAYDVTKDVAKGVMSAAEGKISTNKKIPIPGSNSLRWNVDAGGTIVEPIISFGSQTKSQQQEEEARIMQSEAMAKVEKEKNEALKKQNADEAAIADKYQKDKAKVENDTKVALQNSEKVQQLETLKERAYTVVEDAESLASAVVRDACKKAESAVDAVKSRFTGQKKASTQNTQVAMTPISNWAGSKQSYTENNPGQDPASFTTALTASIDQAQAKAKQGLEDVAKFALEAAQREIDAELAPVMNVCDEAQVEYSKTHQSLLQTAQAQPEESGRGSIDPTCQDCMFEANADVHVEIKVDKYKLQLMECVLEGSTQGDFTVQQQVSKDGSSEHLKPLKTLQLADINLMIGPFPFHVALDLLMTIGLTSDIEGSEPAGDNFLGIKTWAIGNMSQGIKVDANGPSHVNNVFHTVGFQVQGMPKKGEIKLSAYLMPSIQMTIDGILGPLILGEKISLRAYMYGSESSETCPSGQNYVTTDLNLQTDLSSMVNLQLAGKHIYKEVWPTVILDQKTFPLHSGCLDLESSAPPTLTGSLMESQSAVQQVKAPISTGTTFMAILDPKPACSSEYPTVWLACTVHSELDPHSQDAQTKATTGEVPLDFGCTFHRMWEVPVKLPPGVTSVAAGSSQTVHAIQFFQMTYIFLDGVLQPKTPSATCEQSDLWKNDEPGVESDEDALNDPCYIYLHTHTGNLPKEIPDMKFKASLDGDGMTLTSVEFDEGSSEDCYLLPAKLVRSA